MKINNVRAVQPFSLTSPKDWRTSIGQILIAIDTDSGLTGYGVGGGGLAGVHVVRTELRDLLLDRELPETEEGLTDLWEEMYSQMLPFGRKGIAIMALSGVDLALWDLRGKAAGVPVAKLLSEDVRTELPAYVTLWNDLTPEQAVVARSFKLHVEHTMEEEDPVAMIMQRLQQVQNLAGSDCQLMLDAWGQWDQELTLEVAEKISARNWKVLWIEEPLPADDFAGYRKLTADCPIPIAGGEHEFTSRGFAPLIEQKLHAIMQPDVCWCGGMTELVRIYRMSQAAGIRVCPHRGGELWGLHAIAALDEEPLAESPRSWMTWVSGQPPIVNGNIQLPDRPGFGVSIDEEHLRVVPWEDDK